MWHAVTIICKPGFEDIVSLCIFESGFSGIEDRSGPEKTVYTAYYHSGNDAPDSLDRFRLLLENKTIEYGESPAEVTTVEDVPEEDWEASWREGLGVIEVGKRLAVRPSWIEYDNIDERAEVVIDPKMAFGTGSHETTRLCLEILEEKNLKDVSVLDVGCGSGIIAAASVKLGARCAIGFDKDADSITNADENLRANRVQDYVIVYQAELKDVEPGHFNLVFANIISSALIPNIPRFHNFIMPNGTIVFSGILSEEEQAFTDHLTDNGFRIRQVRRHGEWIAFEVEEA